MSKPEGGDEIADSLKHVTVSLTMTAYRVIQAFGKIAPNTEYRVTVNGIPALTNNSALFAFVTPTSLHGSVTVEITVNAGQLTMDSWTATYPAVVDDVATLATFKQPVAAPIAVLKDKQLTLLSNVTVCAGETFKYEHMMFNGPSRFVITTNGTLTEEPLYVGDLRTLEFTDGILTVEAEHDYDKFPNDVTLDSDLDILKEIVYKRLLV